MSESAGAFHHAEAAKPAAGLCLAVARRTETLRTPETVSGLGLRAPKKPQSHEP